MTSLKEKYTQKFIRDNYLVMTETIIGSFAFGLDTPQSDRDLYGVFHLHKDDFFSLQYRMQSDFKDVVEKQNPEEQDITYMEIGKFYELLANNNPNALELLVSIKENASTEWSTWSPDYWFKDLDMNRILSKRCLKTFGEYAQAQIKKARGLNKKIMNPVAPERKTPLDFCKIMINGQSRDLRKFLQLHGYNQLFCGVVALSNARDSYALYYDWISHNLFSGDNEPHIVEETKELRRQKGLPMGYGFKGIEMENSNDIRLSSVPKIEDVGNEITLIGYISYNKDGYVKHCKDFTDYWEWVKKRNDVRYNNNLKQNYDTKNISHCIRLLSVCKEIGEGKGLILKRTEDRDFLVDVKLGRVEYEVAMEYATNIMNDLHNIYESSNLRENPDVEYLNECLVETRKSLYRS